MWLCKSPYSKGLKTAEEALTSKEGEQWKKAMDEEIENLKQMGTWTLQDLPDDWKLLDVNGYL